MEILDSAVKEFEKMVDADKTGVKPLFRDRLWNYEERIKAKENKKLNWYKNDKNIKYVSVLLVPPTPGSILAKDLQKREQEVNKFNPERFKIVETGGVKVEQMLAQKNPFKKERCVENDCPLCKNINTDNEKIKALCTSNNVGYRWICENCRKKRYQTSLLRQKFSFRQVEGKRTPSWA